MRNLTARSLSCALWAVVAACGGGDDGGSTLLSASKLIGGDGGTVELADGTKVEIPAGALDKPTTISVSEMDPKALADLPDHMEAAGKPLAFKPHGQNFAQPVKVTLPFTGSATEVRPLKLDDDKDTSWQTVFPSTIDNGASKLNLNTSSFSVYLPARPRGNSGVIVLPDGAIADPDAGIDAMVGVDAMVGTDAMVGVDASTDAMVGTDAGMDAAIACGTGFTGTEPNCIDIDECVVQTNNCSENATCTNTSGSFTCVCNGGYVGDGVTCTAQEAYVKASNTGSGDAFGDSIAIDGDTLVVGAPNEDTFGEDFPEAGAVYVFTRSGSTWTQQAVLAASNVDSGDYFGGSVAISGDTIVVGAIGESSDGVNGETDNSFYSAGAAYVFTRTGGTWTQQAYLKASNPDAYDYFGSSVAISGDTVVVGAEGEASNAAGVNGVETDNSLAYAGAAYVFTRTGTVWSQQAYLKSSNPDSYDYFGSAVAVSGDTIVAGAYCESSNATGVNGDASNNMTLYSGAAFVFVRTVNLWTQQAYLKSSNPDVDDRFGASVAVSGDTIVCGVPGDDSIATGIDGDASDNTAPESGAAFVFTRMSGTWSQDAFLKPSNTEPNGNVEAADDFGNAVAVDSTTVIVGAMGEDGSATGLNGASDELTYNAGAAYSFERRSSGWMQPLYAKASNTGSPDLFGSAVAVSGTTFAVGARDESSGATGINDTTVGQADDTAAASGAVYVFR